MKKLKEISLVLLFQVVNLLISVFFTPYFLGQFSTEKYGLIILISQITNFIVFLDFGIASFLTQKMSSRLATRSAESNNRLISSSIGLLALIGIVLVPVIIAMIVYFEQIFKTDYILSDYTKLLICISLIGSLVNLFLKPYNSLLYSEERILSLTLLSNSSFVIYNILSVVFVFMGKGINSFFYALIISNFANLVAITLYFRKRQRKHILRASVPKRREIIYFINGGFFLFVNGIAGQIIYNGDRILVAKFVSVSALTLFTVNIRIIEIIQILLFKISDFFIPKIVKIVALSTTLAVDYYVSYTKMCVIAVCFFHVNFLLFNSTFIKLWVGIDFLIGDYDIVCYYLVVCFSHVIFRIPSIFLYASGRNKQYSVFSIMDAVLNLTFSLILVRYMGMKGIVLATIFATGITSVPSNLLLFKKYFHVKDNFAVLIRPILFPMLVCAPILVAGYLFSGKILTYTHNWLEFIAIVVIFNLLFIPAIILLNYRSKSNLVRELKKINHGVYR